MPLHNYLSRKLGKTQVQYGALEGTDAQDEELAYYLDKCASLAVRKHLEHISGVKLIHVLPFSAVHDVMFALYTNVEAMERMEEIDATAGLDDAMDLIDDAIADAGIQSELLWWYDREELRGVVGSSAMSSILSFNVTFTGLEVPVLTSTSRRR